MTCRKKQDAAAKALVPVMSDKERADLEQMATELIRALKYRDIQSALDYFHPDNRAETEQELRDGGLEGVLEDLPDGEPEFEWQELRKANSGVPFLHLANSNAEWGMGWVCCFQDGRWWFT
jgi:hypothetical protein